MKIRGYKGYFTPNSLMGMLKGRVDTSQPLGFFGIIQNLLNYYAHTGITDEKKEDMALQDKYLDENRQQEYDLKEQWYNAHESMPAKKAEYEEAGLNPMLLAGQGSVSASNAPSGQAPSASGTSADPIAAISSLLGVAYQAKDLEATADLKKSQTRTTDIENKWRDKMLEAEYRNKVYTAQLTQVNIRKITADAQNAEWQALYAPDLFQSQIDVAESSVAKAYSDIDKNVSDIAVNDARIKEINELCKNHQKERDQMDAMIDKINQEYWVLCSQQDLNNAMIAESNKRIQKMDEEIKLLGKQIGLTDKDIQWYIWNHSRQSSAFGVKWNTSSQTGHGNLETPGGFDTPSLIKELQDRGVLPADFKEQ